MAFPASHGHLRLPLRLPLLLAGQAAGGRLPLQLAVEGRGNLGGHLLAQWPIFGLPPRPITRLTLAWRGRRTLSPWHLELALLQRVFPSNHTPHITPAPGV